jgi:hypothetical protein
MSSKKDERKDDAIEAKLEQQGKKFQSDLFITIHTSKQQHIHAI